MIERLINLIPPWVPALLVLGAFTLAGVAHARYLGARLDLKNEQLLREQERAENQAAARVQAERFRRQEQQWSGLLQEAQDALARQQTELASFRARLAASDDGAERMRKYIAAIATGGRSAAEDTVASCRDRTTSLGELLEASLRAGEACAGDGEDQSAKLRAVRAAWPVSATTQ